MNTIDWRRQLVLGSVTIWIGLGIGNVAGMNGQGGGVITQTLHTYTPQNPYFEAGGLDVIPIGSSQNVNSVPFTPKNNIVESNEEKGYDATIK